jgi:hypothetical protein
VNIGRAIATVGALLVSSGALGQQLPSTEQFQQSLTACAAGSNLQIDSHLIGSVVNIYNGDKTNGKAMIRSEGYFLDKIPSTDKLKAYELYLKCITTIMPAISLHVDVRFSEATAVYRGEGSFWHSYCFHELNDYWTRYPGNAVLGTPEWYTKECSDDRLKQFDGKGWTINVALSNIGLSAADDVTASILLSNNIQLSEQSLGRIASGVRSRFSINGLTAEPGVLVLCISYHAGPDSIWALFKGKPPNRSGPFNKIEAAKISEDREANKDGLLEKGDDGISPTPMVTCVAKAKAILAQPTSEE